MKSSSLHVDYFMFFAALFLVMLGLLMVTSASMTVSAMQFGSAYHFALRHACMIFMGIVTLCVTVRIPLSFWRKLSVPMLLLALLLLIIVCIPGIGHNINGSRRWLALAGFTFQASELAKCAMILFVSDFLQRRENDLHRSMRPLVNLFILLTIIAVLLLLEPDFGALTVIVSIVMSLTFLAGIPLRYFIYIASSALLALGVIAISAPYRMMRLTSFLNPWQHPFSSGYQLTQSLIAIGRGGVSGLGLGEGMQKLSYLPEAHTDFVFAVIGEELGLIGCGVVLLLLAILVFRGYQVARQSMRLQHRFAGYIGYGVSTWIGVQSAINIGVNAGVLPTKGLTLPLISYGGTSVVMTGLALGWLFRVYHENMAWQERNFAYDQH